MDNTGKTTLVEELCQRFPELTYRPSIGNKHDLNQIKEQAWEEAYEHSGKLILGDRSRIISEFVYNPILDTREIAYGYVQYMDMVTAFSRGRHLVIFAWRPLTEILKTMHEREQLSGVKENAKDLYRAYEHVEGMFKFLFRVSESGSVVKDYDYTDGTTRVAVYHAVGEYIKEVSK